MDITSVSSYRFARSRADLALAPGEVILAGGTWLMSEPQPEISGFVDISRMDWPAIEQSEGGVRIAANCTIAEFVAWAKGEETFGQWLALPLVERAANALLASFKIWNTATVVGNICRSFAAGAMTSLAVALDGTVEIWCPDGSDRTMAVAELITGNGTNSLGPGEVVRALRLPAYALRCPAALQKIALAEHGRSGAVVTGRLGEDGGAVFTVTAATLTPQVLRFGVMPDDEVLAAAVEMAHGYYSDPLGAADWRRASSAVLARRVRRELLEGSVAQVLPESRTR